MPDRPAGPRAERPAERALFLGLFDDAAVFPPGLAPLDTAVANHLARRSASWSDLVGPLLLPPSSIDELIGLWHPEQLDVAVVGRPGTKLTHLDDALSRLDADPSVNPTGVEMGWSADWHRALRWGVSLSVEVPRGDEQERALSDIQDRADDRHRLRAKFRTGSTPESSVPTPVELATFIRACIDHDLAFKLTGGLHHGVSHAADDGEEQFGVLNVIAATRWALAHGGETPEMSSLLSERDPMPLLEIMTRMSEADVSVVRAFFTSYGCCGVEDPVTDLVALGLIEETTG